MNIKDNIGKITWTFADKITMILFGLFTLFQLKYLIPTEYAFYTALLNINNWILMTTDGLALQGLIQFGHKNKEEVNKLSLITTLIFGLGISILFYFIRDLIAGISGSDSYAIALSYLPLSILLTIPKNYVNKIFFRELKFNLVFFLNVVFFGSQVIATVYYIITYGELNFIYMLEIYLFGATCSAIFAVISGFKYMKFSPIKELSIKKYFAFGFTVSQQAILNSLPKVYDFFIVSSFFGPNAAGIYQSAKTLFRVFDEASSAAHGLIYPATVKLLAKNDINNLIKMLSKALSIMLFLFVVAIITLNMGLTEIIINLFSLDKYSNAIEIFNYLVFATLFLPLISITPVLNAMDKYKIVLIFVSISVLFSLIAFYITGKYFSLEYITIGLISYYASLGLLSLFYLKKQIDFPISLLFRSIGDIKNLIKRK